MHARASYLCNDLHLLCWFSLSHSMLLVSIAISSTFPFKLFYWFLWFSGPFLSIPAPLMWFNLLPLFDNSQVNQFILYSTPKSSGLQLSPRNLHLDIPLPSNTKDWCSASCFPPSPVPLPSCPQGSQLSCARFRCLLPPCVSLLPSDLHSLLPSVSNRSLFSFLGTASFTPTTAALVLPFKIHTS